LLLEGKEKLNSYEEVLAVKEELLATSRKDVIKYTDPKYNTTPNRYIYTLGVAGQPDPEPKPIKEDKKKGALYIVGALILAAIVLVILGGL
jgi:hypothetical protein